MELLNIGVIPDIDSRIIVRKASFWSKEINSLLVFSYQTALPYDPKAENRAI